jgi:DNA-binding NarL/FixJ family response regulator
MEEGEMQVILAASQAEERRGLKRLLEQDGELQLVGEVAEADGLMAQVQDIRPNLVLLDWELSGLAASALLRTLHSLCCPLKVIAFGDGRTGQNEAMAAGVDAYVSREEPAEWVLSTLRAVAGLSPFYAG